MVPKTTRDDALASPARARHGRLEAFATWRQLPAVRGTVLDLTRRGHTATPVEVDSMVVNFIVKARTRGILWASLGIAHPGRPGFVAH